jgi:hypothetical protein
LDPWVALKKKKENNNNNKCPQFRGNYSIVNWTLSKRLANAYVLAMVVPSNDHMDKPRYPPPAAAKWTGHRYEVSHW